MLTVVIPMPGLIVKAASPLAWVVVFNLNAPLVPKTLRLTFDLLAKWMGSITVPNVSVNNASYGTSR